METGHIKKTNPEIAKPPILGSTQNISQQPREQDPEPIQKLDFLFYFRPPSFLLAFSGSIVAVTLWLAVPGFFSFTDSFKMANLYFIILVGAFLFFALLVVVCRKAGYGPHESCRISGRRGLFTFTVMLVVVMFSLVISEKIFWSQDFYYFTRYLSQGMIVSALLAVPFDYLGSYFKSIRRQV